MGVFCEEEPCSPQRGAVQFLADEPLAVEMATAEGDEPAGDCGANSPHAAGARGTSAEGAT